VQRDTQNEGHIPGLPPPPVSSQSVFYRRRRQKNQSMFVGQILSQIGQISEEPDAHASISADEITGSEKLKIY